MKNEPTQVFDKEDYSFGKDNLHDDFQGEGSKITFARRKHEGSIFKAFMHPLLHVSCLIVCLLLTTLTYFAPQPVQYMGYIFAGLSVLFAGLLCWRVIREIVDSVDL